MRIIIYPLGTREGGGPPTNEPIPPPPHVPDKEPPSAKLRNRFAREVARWALRAALRLPLGPAGTALTVLETAWWLYRSYPEIISYLDPPKTLDELREAASNPQKGYNIHHVVEQASAKEDGFPDRMVHGRDNLVRIPTYRHWELNAWYGTPKEAFDDMSPRDYLRGKSWEERVRVGHDGLVEVGVLKQ